MHCVYATQGQQWLICQEKDVDGKGIAKSRTNPCRTVFVVAEVTPQEVVFFSKPKHRRDKTSTSDYSKHNERKLYTI